MNSYLISLEQEIRTRLGAQVISGVGFLGAGTILITDKRRLRVWTTAAGIWASAGIGLAIGVGFMKVLC